jgi:Uma2 family endonuclease
MTIPATGGKLITADDLLRLCNARVIKGELVRGVFNETMSAGGEHGEIAIIIGATLTAHVRPNRLGRVAGSDSGVLLERDPDTVREPDVAFFSAETLPLDVKVRGYYEVVPDLVVEIVSPNDSPDYVAQRVAMWHSFGVSLIWAVYPVARTVAAHPLNGTALLYTEDYTLDGGTVLPDFQCTVRDILDW